MKLVKECCAQHMIMLPALAVKCEMLKRLNVLQLKIVIGKSLLL